MQPINTIFRIRCKCGNQTRPHLSAGKALEEAEDSGWTKVNGVHTCPKCSKLKTLPPTVAIEGENNESN